MPLPADLLAPDPAQRAGSELAPFFGARWALGLGAALLLLFALTLTLRLLPSDDPTRAETIVQQPITPEASAAAVAKPSEVTAPDPGDTAP